MTTMQEKLPDLADAELKTLRDNAERLQASGSAAQRTSATNLMPAIEAELATRKAKKQERLAAARQERVKAKAAANA